MKRASRQSLGFWFVVFVAIRERLVFFGVVVFVGLVSFAAYLSRDSKLPQLPAATTYQVMWGGCEFVYVTEGNKPLGIAIVTCNCVPASQPDKKIGSLPDSQRPVYLSEEAEGRYVVDVLPPLRNRNGFRYQISCP